MHLLPPVMPMPPNALACLSVMPSGQPASLSRQTLKTLSAIACRRPCRCTEKSTTARASLTSNAAGCRVFIDSQCVRPNYCCATSTASLIPLEAGSSLEGLLAIQGGISLNLSQMNQVLAVNAKT